MPIAVGDRIPEAPLVRVTEEGPDQIGSGAFFAGRRILLFGLPGAYTPTCSARHLPGYVDQAEAFAAKGIDEVACLSVNDAFVMKAWGKDNNVDGKVALLADGNATFAKALGLDFDGSPFGMGTRSQRFAMLVNDGVVERLEVEQGGSFGVSSAEQMLAQL